MEHPTQVLLSWLFYTDDQGTLLLKLLAISLILMMIAGLVVAIIRHYAMTPAEWLAERKTSAERTRLLAESVRLLESGLIDPMYRQSTDWSEKAQQIVDVYYE